MGESPSLLLQRAADALEQMAKDADGGPWRVDVLLKSCAIKTAEGSPWPGDHVANVGNRFSAHWIATMSPAVAGPLVAWLRDSAESVKEHDRTRDEGTQWSDGTVFVGDEDYCPNEKQALEFARLILEESHET